MSFSWFSGYDIWLEILFAVVTLAIAFYSLKIYRLCGQRESKLFGISFLLVSISYSLWAILNIFALSTFLSAQNYLNFENILKIGYLMGLGIYAHIIFFLAGMVTLAYMTLRIKNAKVYWLLMALTLITALLIEEKYLVLYFISSILLFFISYGYFEDYQIHKNHKLLLSLFAFIFLFLGRFDFVFSSNKYIFYVVGHLFELVAYLLLLISLIGVMRCKPKKVIP